MATLVTSEAVASKLTRWLVIVIASLVKGFPRSLLFIILFARGFLCRIPRLGLDRVLETFARLILPCNIDNLLLAWILLIEKLVDEFLVRACRNEE